MISLTNKYAHNESFKTIQIAKTRARARARSTHVLIETNYYFFFINSIEHWWHIGWIFFFKFIFVCWRKYILDVTVNLSDSLITQHQIDSVKQVLISGFSDDCEIHSNKITWENYIITWAGVYKQHRNIYMYIQIGLYVVLTKLLIPWFINPKCCVNK